MTRNCVRVETEPGLVFDVLVDGPADGPLVLLLHGFAESFHMWRAQLPALAAAGYRAVAPSQRGYSPGARPNTAELANYHIRPAARRRAGDRRRLRTRRRAVSISSATTGAPASPGDSPTANADRVASLTVLSRPHPNAFNRALFMPDGEQARRSRHHKAFLEPDAPRKCWRMTHAGCASAGQSAACRRRRSTTISRCSATRRRWKRRWPGIARAARSARRSASSPCRSLYIWGEADDTVGRVAAEGTRDFVSGPYRFEALPGVGHFAVDQAGKRVTELLLAHLASHPA